MFDRKAFKQEAKKVLKSHYGTPVLITFVIALFNLLISCFNVIPGFGQVIFVLLCILILGLFNYGTAKFYLKYRTDNTIKFKAFWNEVNKTSIVGKTFLAEFRKEIFICLWSFLLVIPGIIKRYSYSQMFFILAENDAVSPARAQKMSILMNKGFKGKLFLLDLSFIGWALLCVLSLGIGFLWLIPYVSQTNANAYLSIKEEALKSGVLTEDDFNGQTSIEDSKGLD